MKEIKIKDQVALVDDEDYDKVSRVKWSLNSGGGRFHLYAIHGFRVNGVSRILSMHRYIIGPENAQGLDVDHINGNSLDNRRSNLRVCTRSVNLHNKHNLHALNTSGTTGVYYSKSRKRWIAEIRIDRKRKHLGRHVNKEDAIKARKEADIKYFSIKV